MFFYRAYELILKSNLAIPGLQKTAIFKQPDVNINLKYPLENIFKQPNWQDNLHYLDFQDGTKYLVNKQATEIFGYWQDDETLESATTYLTGPILGFILGLRGVTCLHASAVNIKGNAIAFMGDSNAGKSTLAGIFAKQGFPVLSDDIVAITPENSHFLVQPAYPRVRLWSNSVILLYETEDALPRIAPEHPTWDKRYLDLNKLGLYQSQPLPLKGIYLIGDRQNEDTAPRIEEIASTEKMINLLANTYASYEFDKKMQIRDFQVFGEIAKKIKIKRLISYKNPKYLDKLCDTILKDLQTNE
jgi:hypothetical protein